MDEKDQTKQEKNIEPKPKNGEISEKSGGDPKQDKGEKNAKPKEEKPKTEIDILKEEIVALKEKLKKELEQKQIEIDEGKKKFAFLQAEMENTRKHYQKQAEIAKTKSKIDVITSFTPLIDSFEMAIKTKEKLKECGQKDLLDSFLKGFENLYQSLLSIFESYNVKQIEALNKPFDFKYHEAVLKMENDALPEDTVIQVAQKGYMMNNEVIRPAKVIISKKTPPAPKAEPEPKENPPKTDNKEPTPKSENNNSKAENKQ
jgi:molecular chaperone GrpE